MAFNVRLFTFTGVNQTPILIPMQDSKDSVFRFRWPYQDAFLAASNGATPVSLGPSSANPDKATVARLEIPDGQAIRYEINNPTRNVAAGNNSPFASGLFTIDWGQQYFLSFVDAASFL